MPMVSEDANDGGFDFDPKEVDVGFSFDDIDEGSRNREDDEKDFL